MLVRCETYALIDGGLEQCTATTVAGKELRKEEIQSSHESSIENIKNAEGERRKLRGDCTSEKLVGTEVMTTLRALEIVVTCVANAVLKISNNQSSPDMNDNDDGLTQITGIARGEPFGKAKTVIYPLGDKGSGKQRNEAEDLFGEGCEEDEEDAANWQSMGVDPNLARLAEKQFSLLGGVKDAPKVNKNPKIVNKGVLKNTKGGEKGSEKGGGNGGRKV